MIFGWFMIKLIRILQSKMKRGWIHYTVFNLKTIQGPSAERIRIQKQLFGFSREVTHGFPTKPSCLAWDPTLKLLGEQSNSRESTRDRPDIQHWC